jgi:hypothetical protein
MRFKDILFITSLLVLTGGLHAYHQRNTPSPDMPRKEVGQLTLKFSKGLVDLLSGRIYDLEEPARNPDAVKLDNLPLADYPFAIVERSKVGYWKNQKQL